MTGLVNSLESDSYGVFNMCSTCDWFGGQHGVRFPRCFHGCVMCGLGSELHGVFFNSCSICEMFGEQFGIRTRLCFLLVQHLWQVW